MAHFCLQVLVALNNPDARHVKFVVFLLQCRCTESHSVAHAEGQVTFRQVAQRQLGSQSRQATVREVIVAQCSHHLPLTVDVPVVLCKGIGCHLVTCTISQLVVQQIVAHHVATQRQDVATARRVVVECSDTVLHIAISAYVEVLRALQCRLVVLVKSV